jgi:hypothetical protein
MVAILRFALLCTLAWAWAEDEAPKPTSIVLPSAFEDGQILVKWPSSLKMSQDKGPDFNVFKIQPDGDKPRWTLSIYDGNHPRALEPDPFRKRDWWPLSRLSVLLIHRLDGGSVWGECYVPAGHEWNIDNKTGTIKWTGPERRIHVMMWFASEADIDSTLTSLEITWAEKPKP